MKKLLFAVGNKSTNDLGLLVLRVGFGILMIPHGWAKWIKFETLQTEFMNFMGLGSYISLCLVIFSQILCSVLLIFGLLTRWASLALIVTALVILSENAWDVFGKAELGVAYLIAYIAIFLLGPGKFSIDKLINSKN